MRFSILTLLGLVAFAAVGCAALLNANKTWASITFSASILILLTSVVAAIFSARARRAFWVGFAVFGCCYFLLYTTVMPNRTNDFATTIPLNILHRQFPVPENVSQIRDSFRRRQVQLREMENFLEVGHALWTLILAFFGGAIARYFYWLRQKQEAVAGERPELR